MSIQSKGIMAAVGTVLGSVVASTESIGNISGSYMKEWEKSRKAQCIMNAKNREQELMKSLKVTNKEELVEEIKSVKAFDELLMSL